MSSPDGLKNFYSGKNIFLTGGSGFLGVCLLEKILRTIPDHGEVYVLLRPKKGKEIAERLETIKTNSVFEELLNDKNAEEVFRKVKAIAGDVGAEGLGLSAEDAAYLKEHINVIFHSAATLDFADSLSDTVSINLLGTRRVVALAKECNNIKAFVHVSSAYVNSYKVDDVEEEILPLTTDADKLIETVKSLSAEELELQTPELLGAHPNTYTITKHMAEHEVQKIQTIIPCAIVRPSMIVGAFKEPVPGWTISKNGPQGFIMGAAKGVIRRLPVRKELIYDYIPVDIVVNNLLAAGYRAGTTKTKTVEVFHCTSSTRNPFCWAMVENEINDYLHEYPLLSAIWYPYLSFVPFIWLFKLSSIFVHFIPALFLDQLLRITGQRPILWRLHTNVNASLDRLAKFIFSEWKFHADKTDELNEWLSKQEQEEYSVSVKEISWPDFFKTLLIGSRIYLNREPLKNLQAARRKDKILKIVHYGAQAVGYVALWLTLHRVFDVPIVSAAAIIPLVFILQSYI